jgi:polyisoprenoid-binding protein YceI
MESFDGKTTQISGWIELDPSALPESLDIEVMVELAAFDTGIALRNRHMRENHLHTSEFPFATLRGGSLREGAGADLTNGAPHDVLLAAEMELHGVTREVELPLRFVYDAASSTLSVASEFGIALSDYGIPRPKFLVMKLGDVQQVVVELSATLVE